jgi:hypothetical protein
MGQILHPRANFISKVSILGFVFVVVALLTIAAVLLRSSYFTGVDVAVAQPVPYSHQLHVDELGLNCRYCHTSVEDSSFAGIPPTETCMTCHSQELPLVSLDDPRMEPVRTSYETGEPVEWNRVHNLGDFVYFNHSIHVNKGIGCESCHGRIDQMPEVAKAESLQMTWCLECHREPEKYIRPREEVFTMGWEPPKPQVLLGRELLKKHNVQNVERLEDCSICHR